MTIGQRIAERRKLLGISQEALGEQMGVSRQAISKWEADGAIPEIDKLIALSKLFGVSVGWLLGTESEDSPKPETGLSEEQLITMEKIVQKYQQPQRKSLLMLVCLACAVAALILPYLIFGHWLHALLCMLGIIVVIIAAFTYYTAVAQDQPFFSRFLEMALISISVAVISFVVGILAKMFLGVDV